MARREKKPLSVLDSALLRLGHLVINHRDGVDPIVLQALRDKGYVCEDGPWVSLSAEGREQYDGMVVEDVLTSMSDDEPG